MSTTTRNERNGRTVTDRIDTRVAVWARRLGLLGGSAGGAIAMWYHPHAGEEAYASLSPVAETFVAMHLVLFASLAAIALGLSLLLAEYRGPAATIGRAGTGVFALCYLGFVALAGIAKGLLIREGQALPAEQQAGVAEVVQYLHTDPTLFAVGAVGAVGYLVAIAATAFVLYRAGAPRVPVALLLVSVVAVGAHQGLPALAGMGSLLVAVAWLEFGWASGDESVPGQ